MTEGVILLGFIILAFTIHYVGMEISRSIIAQKKATVETKEAVREAGRALTHLATMLGRELDRQEEERRLAAIAGAAKRQTTGKPRAVYDD